MVLCLTAIVIVLLSLASQSEGQEESCNGAAAARTLMDNTSRLSRDFTKITVQTFFNIDVEKITTNSRKPSQRFTSMYTFSPHDVRISPEVSKELLIHQRKWRHNKQSVVINELQVSTHYNRYKTIFEARRGEWTLFSQPKFTGRSVTIKPCQRMTRMPFTVKSIKPTSAKGIKQFEGEYFVSLIDFTKWMREAYPDLNIFQNSMMYYFLNQMVWYDLSVQILRDDGGFIRINNGDAIPDHPFDEPVPAGHTTRFFAYECPPLFPGELPIVVFQSSLDSSNFLGVRRNRFGDLELVSDTDGLQESEFTLQAIGSAGFNTLKSRQFCVFVAVDTSSSIPQFELLPDEPDSPSGSFMLIT